MSDKVRLVRSAQSEWKRAAGRKRLSPGRVWFLIPTLAAGLTSCSSTPSEEQSLGVAYVGPAKLVLRTDLTVRSPERITVSHGDRVDILETRRRFMRVRTSAGAQGWTDASTLLTAEQMDDLARLGEDAENLPSQGKAKAFDLLNVHTEANRQAPSFYQIEEDGAVDVIGHQVVPRNRPFARITVAPPEPKRAPKKTKTQRGTRPVLLVPPPPPPKLPPDWQEHSRPRASDLPGYKPLPPAPPPSADDWSLVRSPDGRVGWVLSRMLFMAVPDEIAQYAERQRITAYVMLDDFKDRGENKPSWLWTTASSGLGDAEFDSFRVFVWNAKRQRYETAHIERNLTGYYPIESVIIPGEKEKGFSLIFADKTGQLMERTYSFAGRRVRLISKVPHQRPADVPLLTGETTRATERDNNTSAGWWQRLTSLVRR